MLWLSKCVLLLPYGDVVVHGVLFMCRCVVGVLMCCYGLGSLFLSSWDVVLLGVLCMYCCVVLVLLCCFGVWFMYRCLVHV